jgi:hypothetical protein
MEKFMINERSSETFFKTLATKINNLVLSQEELDMTPHEQSFLKGGKIINDRE